MLRLLLVGAILLGGGAAEASKHLVFVTTDGHAATTRLEAVHFSADCEPVEHDAACTTEIRYTLVGGAEREALAGAFYTYSQPAPPTVTVDGRPPTEADAFAKAIDTAEGGEMGTQALDEAINAKLMLRTTFGLTVEPGSHHEVIWRGRIWAIGKDLPFDTDLEISPLRTRHLVLANKPPFSHYDLFVPVHATGLAVADRTPIDGGVNVPFTWSIAKIEAAQFELRPLALHAAGPIIGLGATQTDGVWLGRLRLGYEIAFGRYFFPSLSVELGKDVILVVPMVRVASPSVLFILPPSIGLGIGVPIQVHTATRVGVRIQLDLHILLLGLVSSIDLFPALGGTPSQAIGQLGTEFSF